jgi:hypothetical protein
MSDRVRTVRDLLDQGITYDEGLRRIDLGDVVYDRARALKNAVSHVREFVCLGLDGPPRWADEPEYKDALPKLERAWREFQETIAEAQRVTGRAH